MPLLGQAPSRLTALLLILAAACRTVPHPAAPAGAATPAPAGAATPAPSAPAPDKPGGTAPAAGDAGTEAPPAAGEAASSGEARGEAPAGAGNDSSRGAGGGGPGPAPPAAGGLVAASPAAGGAAETGAPAAGATAADAGGGAGVPPGGGGGGPAGGAGKAGRPAEVLEVRLRAAPERPRVGDQVSLDLIASSASRIIDAPLQLVYDAAVLRFVEAAAGGFLQADGGAVVFVANGASRPGEVAIGVGRGNRARGIAGEGILCRVRFEAVRSGTASLGVLHGMAWTDDGRTLPVSAAPIQVVVDD